MGSLRSAAPWRAVRNALPEGQSLPDDVWRARHRAIVAVLWAHAAVVPVYALVRGFGVVHALLESAILPTAAALATTHRVGRRTRTAIASVGLLSSSAILVHLSGGVIEMHFHFFVMVALVSLYQDWLPFLAAIGYVFVHHGLLGALDAASVYNHAAARNDPWKWAGIHALFISGISAVCLVTWRMNELAGRDRVAAEERLREETRIVETLHRVGQTLAAELDTQRIVQTVTDAATELSGAAFGAFFYNVVAASGESYVLYTLSGAPVEAFERFGLPRNTEIFAPTFAGERVVRSDDITRDARYGKMGPHHGMPKGHLPVRSYLAVPVRSRTGEVLGGLFFGHPEPARFDAVDERIAVGIAGQAAIAIDNARLYESERQAHTASEAARARLAVLADAGKTLTSSFDVDVALRGLAALVVPAVADRCLVDVVEEDGTLRRIASAGPPSPPDTRDAAHPVVRVIRSGRAELVADGTLVGGPDAVGAAIVAPLVGPREVLGALSVATVAASGRTLGEADVPFVEELGRRVGVAVENARLYARQRTVAETLQHSLLPDRLPEIPGIASAARYVAGGPGVEIGGDWYDVVPLPGGRIGLVIGDVVGRGERAAALMGQLRSALRAYCRDRREPREIVDRLNSLLLDAGPEHMATAVYIVLDPETGNLEYVNAGHPPPLLASPDGTARFLDESRGVPLGALAGAAYESARATLPPGGTLVLYTDGLVEERTAPIDRGMDRLRRSVLDATGDLDDVCTYVMTEALAGHEGHDDAAVLSVRLLPLGDRLELRLPSHPNVLAPLRATMRRWLAGIGASEQESFELLIVVGELCANSIRHASGPTRTHFEVDATVADGEVTLVVSDTGTWRETRSDVGGRGLSIVAAYVDDVDIARSPTGTSVRVRRRLNPVTEPVPAS